MALKTVGAVTLETPSATGRNVIDMIADEAREAADASARASSESIALAGTGRLCPACETMHYGTGPCGQCANFAAQPHRMVLHTDGTWWDREALAEALAEAPAMVDRTAEVMAAMKASGDRELHGSDCLCCTETGP